MPEKSGAEDLAATSDPCLQATSSQCCIGFSSKSVKSETRSRPVQGSLKSRLNHLGRTLHECIRGKRLSFIPNTLKGVKTLPKTQINLHQVAWSRFGMELELTGGDISKPFSSAWRMGAPKTELASNA
jgi:hypothetical protein